MENSLTGPDPGERHFPGQKVHEFLNFCGMVEDNEATAVDGTVALAFDCAGGNEKSLGYTFTDREGSHSIYIPKPPDHNDLLGFKVRDSKEQEIQDNKPQKKASVKIKSIRISVFQDQTCIISEGFVRSDSHPQEQCKELRQSIVQTEGEYSKEEDAPGQEKILNKENEPLKKASVIVNYISVNVLQNPVRKTWEQFGHPGGYKGELCKQLIENIVQGECSAEKCMPGQEDILAEETVSAQPEHHRAEPICVENAGGSEYRQPAMESAPYMVECEQNSLEEEGYVRAAGSNAPLVNVFPIEEGADYIKSLMTRVSGVQKKKILTCIAFFLVWFALFSFPPLRDVGLLKKVLVIKMRNATAAGN